MTDSKKTEKKTESKAKAEERTGTSNPEAEQGTVADIDVHGTAPESHAEAPVDTNADIARPK